MDRGIFMSITQRSAHEFHIPVMGTGFTIGTPIEVARYGIASVISLVDDVLIEQMRRYYSEKHGYDYEAIGSGDPDVRARRISAYLNLVDSIVAGQVRALQASPFSAGSEIVRYYELLPESPLKAEYRRMCGCTDQVEKVRLQSALRQKAVPGGIDVNIMTKLDRTPYRNGCRLGPEFRDATSALRGFATSSLSSSIVFSAGLNSALYSSLCEFPDFLPTNGEEARKRVTLKVSDYRSALIQGRFLAKRGIWVSEFRIESGLNCGGHAFATQGYLMGPIMDEFTRNRESLITRLHADYNKGLVAHALPPVEQPRAMMITVQGGIGTHAEHHALLHYFKMDRTGWATPFLLVPEATSVDEVHLQRLLEAQESDIEISDSSPMGVPFWTLRTSDSETGKRARIAAGKPGSACPKGFLRLNDEFSEVPMCTASRGYQTLKLRAIEASAMSEALKAKQRADVLAKACICHELGGGATRKHGMDPDVNTAVCPSLNIVHFKALASLEEMIGHIYGRLSLLKDGYRPHMFIRELMLYVEHFRRELDRFADGLCGRNLTYYEEFKRNLLGGIEYYQERFRDFVTEHQERFGSDLQRIKVQIEQMPLVTST